jgi:hypothetical protein
VKNPAREEGGVRTARAAITPSNISNPPARKPNILVFITLLHDLPGFPTPRPASKHYRHPSLEVPEESDWNARRVRLYIGE